MPSVPTHTAHVHRKPGEVDWPNPNLDVAYSEAWVAIDEASCAAVLVPHISGRYYTMQFLNGWGEMVANLNERVFPQHPHGQFAVCLKGSRVEIPDGVQRVDVPVKCMRVLSRVELGANWDEAVALQFFPPPLVRAYWPMEGITKGDWSPPPVTKAG